MSNSPNVSLPISNIIDVSVVSPGAALGLPNMSALALFTKALAPAGWSVGQTYGLYKDPDSVAADWGLTSDVFAIANAVFAQTPNILSGGGYLVIVPRLQSPSLETTQEAIARMLTTIFFQGVLIDEEMGGDVSAFLNLADYCQGIKRIFGYCSSNIADLQPGSMLDQVRTRGDFYTRCFYYGMPLLNGAAAQQTQMFSGAYLGRAMCVDFAGPGTVLSMFLKELATIGPDQTVSETNWDEAEAAGVDLYVSTSGINGVQSFGANVFFDQVYCRAWFAFQLAVNGFNFLKQTGTKVPQTEDGVIGLQNAYAAACAQGVRNGYLAPGAWTLSTKFGDPEDLVRCVLDFGYYLYHVPVAQQSPSDRAARKAPLIQIAAKEAGAVQQSSVIVNVNA